MALCWDCDIETGLLQAYHPKLEVGVVGEDKTCSKEDLSGTPFSQASTAPSTPFSFFLPDPFEVPPLPNLCGSPPKPPPASLEAALSFCMAQWWTKYDNPEHSLPFKAAAASVSPAPLSISSSPWWSQYRQHGEAPVFCEPSLQSDLAKWAEEVLEAATSRRQEYMPRSQQQFAVLESVFAERLSGASEYEYRVSEYPPRNQQAFAVLEFVRSRDYYQVQEDTAGFAEEFDLIVQLPVQEPSDDEEDEWFKVDEAYIPSVLEGMCVLTTNLDSVGMAGHALTLNGQVIDLNGGGEVSFACQPEHSFGHVQKCAAINSAKISAELRVANRASDVQAERVCSIDSVGRVRGGQTIASRSPVSETSIRLKLLHRKRTRRQSGTKLSKHAPSPQVLSVDAAGNVMLHLYLNNFVAKSRRVARLSEAHRGASASGIVMSIDATGVTREVDEDWFVRRNLIMSMDMLLEDLDETSGPSFVSDWGWGNPIF